MIIVASVSCIYGLGDPEDYSELVLSLRLGQTKSRDEILSKLVDIQYTRNDMNFIRGTFRVQGDTIEIFLLRIVKEPFEWNSSATKSIAL